MNTKGISLIELLIILSLLSTTTLLALKGFTHLYEDHQVKAFSAQLSAAINLAQTLSLSRNEDIIVCAEKANACQENWQGDLIVQNKTQVEKDFGTIPKLNIHYQAFYSKEMLLIQNHGGRVNNGTFYLTTSSQQTYQFTLSKQGILIQK